MIVSAEQILANIRGEQPDKPRNQGGLTNVEHRVLRLIADGASDADIAEQSGVSRDTVKTQAKAVYRKLGASSRANAVHLGHQKGLLS